MTDTDDEENPFRPVWEDNEDESAADLPFSLKHRTPIVEAKLGEPEVLRALLDAEKQLTRLDTLVGTASSSIKAGLIARLAFREAAGWLAQACQWVHPNDIALRDLGMTGSYIASAKVGKLKRDLPNTVLENNWNEDENTVVGDRTINLALSFTKILRRKIYPLDDASLVQARMTPIGWAADALRTSAVTDLLCDFREDVKKIPAIVAASNAAAMWKPLDDGFEDEVDLRAGFILSSAMGKNLHNIPLPFWTARPVIYGLHRSGSPFGKNKLVDICNLISESSISTVRELERLSVISKLAEDITKNMTKRSQMGQGIDLAIRVPILTPKVFAHRLKITHQSATRLLNEMSDMKIVKESTGRKNFRGFAV